MLVVLVITFILPNLSNISTGRLTFPSNQATIDLINRKF